MHVTEAKNPIESAGKSTAPPLLSVVVPVLNEQDNIRPLISEIIAALDGICDFEIVYVDDGSTDGTRNTLVTLKKSEPRLRVIVHDTCTGQSAGLRTGVMAAHGDLIATLDGDGQNDPADIPKLLKAYQAHDGARRLMVTGHRVNRRDSWAKRRASRIANAIRRTALRDDNPDTGCSLKLYERSLFLRFPYFDHMHRFLPALAKRENCVVKVVPVNHRHRTQGRSKYTNMGRLLVGIPDLIGMMWLIRRSPGALKIKEQR
jgi:dolichol-phosphate mannosyltransferase